MKTYNLILLLAISIILFTEITQANSFEQHTLPQTSEGSVARNQTSGIRIFVKSNISIYNITLSPNITATDGFVWVLNETGGASGTTLTIINQSRIVNGASQINVSLIGGRYYTIVVTDPTNIGGWTQACNMSASSYLPIRGVNIDWVNGSFQNVSQLDDYFCNIRGISYTGGDGFVTLESPINGSIVSSNNISFIANYTANGTSLFNATYYIWNSNSTLFNQTTILVNGSFNRTSLNVSNFVVGQYFWNVLVCGSNGFSILCDSEEVNSTFYVGATELTTSYNNITYQGQQESFVTNITVPGGASFSAFLVWNNTVYPGDITGSGVNYTLSRNITIPVILGTINWSWRLDFSNGFQQNLSTHMQEIRALALDNCTVFTNEILNFTLFDEDLRTEKINGTIEVIVNLWNNQRTAISGTFNRTYTVLNGGPARVCADSLNSTFSMDYQAKYFGNSSYVTEYKFAQAISLTNITAVQNVNLYDLLDVRSTAFTITLQSPDLSLISGAVIDVQRQYIPINQFISVESPLTNNLGEAVAHLVHNEVYYNFVVSRNGTILGTFNNYLVQCQNFVTGDCRISLNLIESVPALPNFQTYGNITGSFTWQPSARNLFFTFFSSDGLTHNVSWNVLKLDNWGNDTICTQSAVSTTGTFQCNIPLIYGNSSILAQIFVDGVFLGNNIFSLNPTPGSIFGGTRVILAILMYSSITLMFIASPVMLIIGAMLGMIFAAVFHLVDGGSFIGNASIILWFIIAGGVILYYMRNKT